MALAPLKKPAEEASAPAASSPKVTPISIPSLPPSQSSNSLPPTPSTLKPILKVSASVLEVSTQQLALRTAREACFEQAVDRLKKGDVLTKYDSHRRPLQRRFAVSEDGTELLWGKPKDKSLNSRCMFVTLS